MDELEQGDPGHAPQWRSALGLVRQWRSALGIRKTQNSGPWNHFLSESLGLISNERGPLSRPPGLTDTHPWRGGSFAPSLMTSPSLSDQTLTPRPHLRPGAPLPPLFARRDPNSVLLCQRAGTAVTKPQDWEQGAVLEPMLTAVNCTFNKGGHGPSV